MKQIGILHPGEMGVSIAASAMNSGHPVYWVSTNRSEQTRLRAEKNSLIELKSLAELCQICEVIISICPPHAAEEVARSVITEKFRGIYLDANAISPQRVRRLQQMMEENGIHFIDGSIIGGPAWKAGETFLYLSGKGAEVIRDCFQNGPLEIKIIGDEAGKASAIKMCYAAYSKGTTALLEACEVVRRDVRAAVAELSDYQRPTGLVLTTRQFSIHSGELTSNLKLRRRVIEERFAPYLEELFLIMDKDNPAGLKIAHESGEVVLCTL